MSGQELGELLEARGWTQRAFAAHIGVSAKSVTRWVHDRWPVPRTVEVLVQGLPRYERTQSAA